jgi:2-oxoisovalerate dehydrogenase E2 component (dihydrolipoyl transacylase)
LPESVRPGVKVIPLTAIRARIAEKMVLTKQKIPHAGCSIEVDMTEIVNWRRKENEAFKAREGFSISYLPFAIVAVTKIMAQHPLFNSSLKEAEGKKWIEQYDYVNAGLAVATEMGLLLPVIKNAHQKNFLELAREVNRLSLKGKKGELSVEELTGGTFTFNNSGALGAIRSQQVIPPPQVAILAMNRIVRRPWVVKDKQGSETVAIRSIVDLDLAFDHRIIDGDHAVRFLVAIREQLESFDFSKLKSEG